MTTSRASSHAAGFEQAVKAYFDDAIEKASAGAQRRALEEQRKAIISSNPGMTEKDAFNRGMSDMLAILDAQDDDYQMSKGVALFYTGWSPDELKVRVKHPLYPYAEGQKLAIKCNIDGWLIACIEGKHPDEFKSLRSLDDWGRDVSMKRPYLIDVSTGVVICDGVISGLDMKHGAALGTAKIQARIYTFAEALVLPWQDEAMRQVWVRGYRRYLRKFADQAELALATFDSAVLHRGTPEPKGPSKPRRA